MESAEQAISKIILDESVIMNRVQELGQQITSDFAGKSLYIIGVLTGAVPFVADLIRNINLPLELDFVAATSYGNDISSSGEVRLIKDIGHPIEGKTVLLV
jgi:hypoxanthine phosphoribosyltransferase